jgi:hypothetical protein
MRKKCQFMIRIMKEYRRGMPGMDRFALRSVPISVSVPGVEKGQIPAFPAKAEQNLAMRARLKAGFAA